MVRVKRKPPHNNQYGWIGLLAVVVVVAGLTATVVANWLGPAAALLPLTEFPHESVFRSTLHQCLPLSELTGGAKCKQYIAPGESSRQRIAFLAPPGDVSASILKLVQSIALLYNNNRSPKQSIEVIGSTHVPPYGYGKTHGYTKIIRLVPNPLILDVADVLHTLVVDQDTTIDVDTVVRTVLRQVLRFHCRLSHVAAHTALLTLDVAEQTPEQVVQQLVSFITGADNQAIQDQVLGQMSSLSSVLRQAHNRAAHLLKHTTPTTTNLDGVLMEDLVFTKNMTVWPCPSFWSAADDNGVVPTSSSTTSIGQLLAQALSPNCSDPMASCFVKRDKCEAAGDALCKGK